MRLALIFNRGRPDTTGGYFVRAAQALGIACESWELRDAEQIPATADLYVRVDHGDDYLATLPPRLRPAVFYAIDTHLAHSWKKIRASAPRYDLVCCAQRAAAIQLPNGMWLPLACDPSLSESGAPSGPWDVAFVGTDGGNPRKFILQALRERYPRSFIGAASHAHLMPIYGQARIGFNYAIRNEVNMRLFEVLGAGSVLVTNMLAHDDLEQLGLQDGVHLVCYRWPSEIMERVDALLADAPRCRRIAQAGQAVARQRHTYVHRLQQLLETVATRFGVT